MTPELIILAVGTILGSNVLSAWIRSRDERRKETIQRPVQIDDANLKALEAMRLVMEQLRAQGAEDRERITALEETVASLTGERDELIKRVGELEAENRRLKQALGLLSARWERHLPNVPFPAQTVPPD